jgi:hypothetical protein
LIDGQKARPTLAKPARERRRLMRQQQAWKSRKREKRDDDLEPTDESGKGDTANDVSAVTEEVLDDIDRVLKAQCGGG